MQNLEELAKELDQCAACPLRTECKAPVGWYGDITSPLMFVGEGPGGQEDIYGCPLIGPAGQMLDRALWSLKMTRDRVLTTNVVKCRPKGNRTPTEAEGSFCAERFLRREIELLKPSVIVALGSVALRYLGGSDKRITRERGRWFTTTSGILCIATFHPSYLLRLTGEALVKAKWDVYYDLAAAKEKALSLRPQAVFGSSAPLDLRSQFAPR